MFSLFISSLPPPGWINSQPVRGYLFNSIQSNLYDDKRQALYGLVAERFPNFSQNMRCPLPFRGIMLKLGRMLSIFLRPILLNRGFQSMALDTARGYLYFGWYDTCHAFRHLNSLSTFFICFFSFDFLLLLLASICEFPLSYPIIVCRLRRFLRQIISTASIDSKKK